MWVVERKKRKKKKEEGENKNGITSSGTFQATAICPANAGTFEEKKENNNFTFC